MSNNIRVALAQFPCAIGNKQHNLKKMSKYAAKAHNREADLLIFPEMSSTGYTLRDLNYELAEEIPGKTTEKIEKLAKEHNVNIVFGMPEKSEKGETILYNTAIFVSPEGYIGKYRKLYLPTHSVFEEKRYFRSGYHTPVFQTKIGTIGIMICYDIFFPEVSRALRLQGAKLIICISASPATRRSFFETLTMARSIENTCYLAYVNLVGIENGLQFWGGSRLISPSGHLICRLKHDEEDFSYGDIDYDSIKPIEAFVPTLRDLRPEIYDKLRNLSECL
jgi:predicted amidohydrolase